MCQNTDSHHAPPASTEETPETEKPPPFWRIPAFLGLLAFDLVSSLLILTPLLAWVRHAEDQHPHSHYSLARSVLDVCFLAAARLVACIGAILWSYLRGKVDPEWPFELCHPNGDKKTREELEEESMEEAWGPWFRRLLKRPSLIAEVITVITQLLVVIKCLWRMNLEMGVLQDKEPMHPLYWCALLLAVLLSAVEASLLESITQLAAKYGEEREQPTLLRRIASSMSVPLLNETDALDVEQPEEGTEDNAAADAAEERGVSDITGDTDYKASWSDLIKICYPDMGLISLAFVFLMSAAICQVGIPYFLGNILDSLKHAFDNDDDASHGTSMWEVPGFIRNVQWLVVASIGAGVFSGLRGSLFTVVGGRANVRLRVQLLDALLSQDIGFFDVTKTGDITSRLSSDTTLVGDQVTLNVNVFLRSLVQAGGVLACMLLVSWQLSILAFISVPLITLLSKWYGNYIRSLTKLMQKKLADGNSICEAALGSMPTVRAFDAAEAELREFETFMSRYLTFNGRLAVSYCGFAAMSTALPQLVFAVVVFYGGLLVRNEDMTSGQLVSFLLYLQSLSDAFSSLGWIFSSLTQAVGAADKVFELMHRKPRMKTPSTPSQVPSYTGLLGVEAAKTRSLRMSGQVPATSHGDISLEQVDLFYPARPKRKVLDQLSLNIEPGSIVALVGQSGGGKSSVMSVIQHLYEPSTGSVRVNGMPVHEIRPSWLSRHVSIVSQEPTLFARSIRRNIMYGLEGTDQEPSQEEIEEAARLANAHDFIQNMPQKYDTEVGERGVQLSGGQKQRIAIARAIVRKPAVLLLDEATSALDAESEHLVQQSIDEMITRGKNKDGTSGQAMTVIIVAHRLSTVRSADRIFVIKEGKVVENGSHDELIRETDGAYSALIQRQMDAQQKLENGKAPS